MASYVPPGDPGGSAGSQEPESAETVPGWRKPIALVGIPRDNPPSRGAFPHLPSVITLPLLPGLPTEITLPPGL